MRAPLLSLPLAVALATAAAAQISTTGPFVGDAQEGFEGKSISFSCVTERIFGDQADLCSLYSGSPGIYSSWGAICSSVPQSGSAFLSSPTSGHLITFDKPVYAFGGYFSTSGSLPNAFTVIRDMSGGVMAIQNFSAPNDCNWYWAGWRAAAGMPIGSIELCSNHSSGQNLGLDGLQVDFDPPKELAGFPGQVSISGGGSQQLTIDLDDTLAGTMYQVLGSVTGTMPGIPVAGVTLPLNLDPYFLFTLSVPNSPILNVSLGLLDQYGMASLRFALIGVTDPALMGVTVNHAAIAIDFPPGGGFALAAVTNAQAVMLVP
jgi:hypothetical protein